MVLPRARLPIREGVRLGHRVLSSGREATSLTSRRTRRDAKRVRRVGHRREVSLAAITPRRAGRRQFRPHPLGIGARKVARDLGMSSSTELAYQRSLGAAGVLEGSADGDSRALRLTLTRGERIRGDRAFHRPRARRERALPSSARIASVSNSDQRGLGYREGLRTECIPESSIPERPRSRAI